MRRTVVAVLLSLSIALPLAAQNAGDFEVTLRVESSSGMIVQRAAIRGRVYFVAQIRRPLDAPAALLELELPGESLDAGSACSGTRPLRCPIPAGSNFYHVMVGSTMNEPGVQTGTARLIAPNDPNPQNDRSSVSIEVIDAPSLAVRTYRQAAFNSRVEPGEESQFVVDLTNYDGKAARDVVLTLTLPERGVFTGGITASDPAATCAVTAATVTCTLPVLNEDARLDLLVDTKAPDRLTGGEFTLRASVRSAFPDFDESDNVATAASPLIRHLLVTSTNDEGSGSLRQALLDARQFCMPAPCTIGFRIPAAPANGVFVIRPRTALPEVRGTVKIDGGTQRVFGGDTNPIGPEIELDGSLTTAPAHGLFLGLGCDMQVLDLAIRNFPSPGIEAMPNRFDVDRCSPFDAFPGTRIERNQITGNDRGIAVSGTPTTSIAENFVGANRRAGIFVENAFQVWISRNFVAGNGASGLFVDATYGRIDDNRVTANGEWGIARTPRGDVALSRNTTYGNRYLGIDSGLDFETPNREHDAPSQPPNKPVLFSASYDPVTNKTTIRGRLDTDPLDGGLPGPFHTIDLFASRPESGEGQAEQWIGSAAVAARADFTIEVEGDHRGKRITATHTRTRLIFFDERVRNTSELSSGVVVP